MIENTHICENRKYVVAKIFGTCELKKFFAKQRVAVGKTLTITKIQNKNAFVRLENTKKIFSIPLSYLKQMSLVDADIADCQNIVAKELNEIKVSIIQTAESFPTELFLRQTTYKSDVYNFCVCYLPQVDDIFGNDYQNKLFRNLILTNRNDVFVAVVDFYKLEDELIPLVQMMDLGVKIVVLLRGYSVDIEPYGNLNLDLLSNYLGMPIALYSEIDETDESRKSAIQTIISAYTDENKYLRNDVHANYGRQVEKHIDTISRKLRKEQNYDFNASTRFMAISLLEDDTIVQSFNTPCKECKKPVNCFVKKQKNILGKQYNNHIYYVLRKAYRSFIDGLLINSTPNYTSKSWKQNADKILLHSALGFPIFLIIMCAILFATAKVGSLSFDFIYNFFANIAQSSSNFTQNWTTVITSGLLKGFGCVLAILPSLVVYYLLVSILEASGYLQRAAFATDGMLRKFGIQAKSLIPSILGFGCSIPAILATKNIKNKADRIITSLIIPFIPCIAKFPIFLSIALSLFPNFAFIVIVCAYLLDILLSIVFAKIYSKTFCKQTQFPNVLELTPYRRPTFFMIISKMWTSCWQFVKRSAVYVFVGALLVSCFAFVQVDNDNATDNMAFTSMSESKLQSMALCSETQDVTLQNSLLEKCGKAVQPIFSPLGFDWQMSVASITGMFGKEILIGSCCVLKSDADEKYDLGAYLAFMVFILVSFPCFGAVASIGKVSGVKWAVLNFCLTTLFAWLLAFGVNSIVQIL